MTNPRSASPRKKILVGMSGGVDSSVSAALLVEQGYDVTGGFIKNWSDTKDLWTGECEWRGERRDAMRVAAKLGIPLLTFDFEKDYRARVLDRMFREYEFGITPNPDVLCNEEIKFGLFFEAAMKLGFDGIATGHYARIVRTTHEIPLPTSPIARGGASKTLPLSTGGVGGGLGEGTAHLLKAVDADKDQSYFLHRVSQEALAKSLFPIGEFPKAEVRRLAEKFELPVASKPDSQGICFVGKVDFHDFLRKKIKPVPGEIVTKEGEVIGTHDGLDAYTIGQRHGLNVSKGGKTWYVAGKDRAQNRLIAVPDREDPLLYRDRITVRDVHWIAGRPTDAQVEVAVRYHSEPISGRFEGDMIHLDRPAWAPAPGQSAVIYQGDECLGGGFLADDGIDSPEERV